MKQKALKFLRDLIIAYVVLCGLLFFFQEKIIFHPEKLPADYAFDFTGKYEEVNVKTADGTSINALFFHAEKPKGIIFYLHGNAGSIRSWGDVARTYTALNYDVFIPDYRGFGKSGGTISGEKQLFSDMQAAYDFVKSKTDEKNIVVLGYSIGTGPAAKIASVNKPKMLILQAPFYNMIDMMKHVYPQIIPSFLLKYKFATNEYIADCKMPIFLFHGNRDEVVYYGSSVKLKSLLKQSDVFITLNGQGHMGITDNPEYIAAIKGILGE